MSKIELRRDEHRASVRDAWIAAIGGALFVSTLIAVIAVRLATG